MGAHGSNLDDILEEDMHHWYTKFMKESPSGLITLFELKMMLEMNGMTEEASSYVDQVFVTFDMDGVSKHLTQKQNCRTTRIIVLVSEVASIWLVFRMKIVFKSVTNQRTKDLVSKYLLVSSEMVLCCKCRLLDPEFWKFFFEANTFCFGSTDLCSFRLMCLSYRTAT